MTREEVLERKWRRYSSLCVTEWRCLGEARPPWCASSAGDLCRRGRPPAPAARRNGAAWVVPSGWSDKPEEGSEP